MADDMFGPLIPNPWLADSTTFLTYTKASTESSTDRAFPSSSKGKRIVDLKMIDVAEGILDKETDKVIFPCTLTFKDGQQRACNLPRTSIGELWTNPGFQGSLKCSKLFSDLAVFLPGGTRNYGYENYTYNDGFLNALYNEGGTKPSKEKKEK